MFGADAAPAELTAAAEYFAALLQDNDAAKILGEHTMGVGYGYTNGGVRWVLPKGKLRVWMPGCVRYRKNGGIARRGGIVGLLCSGAARDESGSADRAATGVMK